MGTSHSEKNVLPTPEIAEKSARHGARFIMGKLIRRGKSELGGNASETRKRRSGGNGTGFIVSFVFHAAFLIFALFWITNRIRNVPEEEKIAAFVTGSGGGKGEAGRNVCILKERKPLKVKLPRITSKSQNSSITLPELNAKMPDLPDMARSLSALSSSGLAFGGNGGFGGGIGGGIDAGIGVGIGNAKNYVGQFTPRKVMGATIFAQKVAVYLDCSGSMLPYLPQVRKEIYDKYPDADIFEFDGIRTLVHDGEIVGGKYSDIKNASYSRYGIRLDATVTDKLSPDGKRIHKKYANNFEQGSVGAWLDVMLNEKYDALVIFSDFQDGIRQFDKNGKVVFAESVYQPTETDGRKNRDMRWQTRWHAALSRRKNSLKIYLFTIGIDPQKFLSDCVELSGGEITDVRYLRDAVIDGSDRPKRKRSSRARSQAPKSGVESPIEMP